MGTVLICGVRGEDFADVPLDVEKAEKLIGLRWY